MAIEDVLELVVPDVTPHGRDGACDRGHVGMVTEPRALSESGHLKFAMKINGPFAFSILPDHCASEKYACKRLRNSRYINELRLRTFDPTVHRLGEKGLKRRQMGR